MTKEKVAVIGGGGRESALMDKYLQSEHVAGGIGIPGNDMMKARQGKPVETFPKLKTTDVADIVAMCKDRGVTYVDVAQENGIAVGLVNALQKEGIQVLGPTKEAGQIESCKEYSRLLERELGLPQPNSIVFDCEESGISYILNAKEMPRFVKANGLCEGKGAIPAETREDAIEAITEMKAFKNDAGSRYLVEDWLRNDDDTNGEEFSAFAISDGMGDPKGTVMLGYAQDHKRANDGDTGKNTGGMGCSTPPLVLTPEIEQTVEGWFGKIIPALREHGTLYTGVLYLGGILIKRKGTLDGHIIEWNARWGDPEAQVIVPGIKNDMFELGTYAIEGHVKDIRIETDGKARVVVAGTSRGYPGDYSAVNGKEILGLDRLMAHKPDNIEIYGAGVRVEDGKYYAMGGRLFYIVGEGKDVVEARQNAYVAISSVMIDGNNLHYRTDIGWRDIERLLR